MFINIGDKIYNASQISWIDCKNYINKQYITIRFAEGEWMTVSGVEALNIIQRLCPNILEGKRAKYIKHAWALHNLVGHPGMQLAAFLGFTKLSLWLHDITLPKPEV